MTLPEAIEKYDHIKLGEGWILDTRWPGNRYDLSIQEMRSTKWEKHNNRFCEEICEMIESMVDRDDLGVFTDNIEELAGNIQHKLRTHFYHQK